MIDWSKLPKLLDHLKGRYFFVVALVLLVVLITPDALSERLGFDAWLNDYRAWVGVILIGAFLVWLVKVAAWIGELVNTRWIA